MPGFVFFFPLPCLKLISSASVSPPAGISSITLSTMYTRCSTWRWLGSVFWRAGFM